MKDDLIEVFQEVVMELRRYGYISDYEARIIFDMRRDIARDLIRCNLGKLFNDFYLLSNEVGNIIRELNSKGKESYAIRLKTSFDDYIDGVVTVLKNLCGCKERGEGRESPR